MTKDVDDYDYVYCDSYYYGDDFDYHPNSEFLGSNISMCVCVCVCVYANVCVYVWVLQCVCL